MSDHDTGGDTDSSGDTDDGDGTANSGGRANEIGPAGTSTNEDVGNPVSGQPAGGPHDLGEKAHERNPNE